jgi:hypothetical protein
MVLEWVGVVLFGVFVLVFVVVTVRSRDGGSRRVPRGDGTGYPATDSSGASERAVSE